MNIAKLLRGCEGEKFYTLDRGEMVLLEVCETYIEFIEEDVFYGQGRRLSHYYQKDGRIYEKGECLVFPSKTQRDWTKFNKEEICNKFRLEKFHYEDEVLVRNNDKEIWKKRKFAEPDNRNGCRVACVLPAEDYYQCIPYNADTKHLLRTKKTPNEYYIWW